MKQIISQHGWGLDQSIWDNLKEEFQRQCDMPVPQYSYREPSVLNNYQFYYNLTKKWLKF